MTTAFRQVKFVDSPAVVVERCRVADSMVSRLVGLLNHDTLPEGEGLLIKPCNQVHTFFMRFAIDAVFLSGDDEIVAVEELKPWRVSKLRLKARKVLELPLGTSRRLGLERGRKLVFV